MDEWRIAQQVEKLVAGSSLVEKRKTEGTSTLIVLLFASLAHAGNMLFTDHPLVGKIWDMNNGSYIDKAALLARINTANVLLLGETHDNPQHHEHQQKLLKARIESGARPALMMEQLDAVSQPALDQALAGSNRDEVLNRDFPLAFFKAQKQA